MYKIIYIIENTFISEETVESNNWKDPFFISVKKKTNPKMQKYWGRDFTHLKDFSNKGVTEIILFNEQRGITRWKKLHAKMKFFGREIIVLVETEEQMHYIRSIK